MDEATTFDLGKYRQIDRLLIDPAKLDHNTVDSFTPELRMVDPTVLFVDEKYQRNPTKASMKLIKKIIKEFSWDKYKPPIVTEYEDFKLCVIDGQHTAIACATHPDINLIPVFIVPTGSLEQRAKAFIGHNTNRTNVNEIQLFKAKLEAGDEDAISINMALQRSGVELSYGANFETRVGACGCLKTLESVYHKYGVRALRITLDVCIASKLAPIQAHYVIAISELIFGKENKDKFDLQGIALTIRDYPYNQLVADIEVTSRIEKIKRYNVATTLIKNKYLQMFGEDNVVTRIENKIAAK